MVVETEVEVKFHVKSIPDILTKLTPIFKKKQSDIYYDKPEYSLLRGGNFMRIRDNSCLDFKLYSGDLTHLSCNEININLSEIYTHSDVVLKTLDHLGLKYPKTIISFDDILSCNQMIVLANINKERLEYCFSNGVTVYFDNVYNLGCFIEADIMIPKKILLTTIKEAEDLLLKTLFDNEIINGNSNRVRLGYVELFLQKNNPIAFELGLYK